MGFGSFYQWAEKLDLRNDQQQLVSGEGLCYKIQPEKTDKVVIYMYIWADLFLCAFCQQRRERREEYSIFNKNSRRKREKTKKYLKITQEICTIQYS